MAIPICLRFDLQAVRRADSRTDWIEGKSSPTKTAMMAITTSSSTSVMPKTRRTAGAFRDGMRLRSLKGLGERYG